jgi:hypothetical protein
MVVHALGSDLDVDSYLRGDESVSMKETFKKYLPQIVIAAAVMVAILVMVGTGGKRRG